MEIWQFFVVFAVGALAGFMNVLAGGGSILTLPMLIFLGLPPAVANGTNRLAVVVQSIFAVAGFRSKGVSDFKSSLILSCPALLGGLIGAQLAVAVSDQVFKKVLAIIMIFILGFILWDPIRKKQGAPQHKEDLFHLSVSRRITIMVFLFFAGIYGGFVQAGVGFLIIMALNIIGGLNLVKTNSHKVFIAGINAIFSLLVFVFYSKISWIIGLVLAAGNGLGGWTGSHFAVSKGEGFIRIVLTLCVIAMVVKLLI
ncbi:MAG: integrase [Candidatus Brocadia sp.]|nr:putative membrane transporter protein YfcA [Candidatus Brocadia fulgida]MCC6324425.1 sulfite exporter TauE/SafE family protein [Candidatus Brocadia sp.]MCE7910513.1 sulfite exporter TauE/SafE family protein [Candidatus Brocadia sp. AMX3]MDG5996485.1 sulfite exporter TauE/SafE family protein [Candidatus Brocadia sp.]RIK03085.1 MAG: integrase [Candidatus Brocadia sp.]